MAIVVEDGTGVTGAQAYIDVAYLDAYMSVRGYTTTASTADKEAAIIIAAQDWIDGEHSFSGVPLNSDQGLAFPRGGVGLPEQIKLANAQAAYLQLNRSLLVDVIGISVTGVVESESKSVGPLSKTVKYAAGTAQRYGRVLPRSLTNLLRPYLLNSGSMGLAFRV